MLVELVRAAASRDPDHPAVLSPATRWSYGELAGAIERCARRLADRGITRFGTYVHDSPELVALLGAASWIGAETCVLPRDAAGEEASALAASFDFARVVTDAAGTERPDHVPLGELFAEGGDALADVPPPRRDGPVLILTTGTTGRPRAARYTWDRLVAPTRSREGQRDTRWLLAYNLNQFGGMQMLLHVLVNGATLVVPASPRPADALEAVARFGVTHASATPTFWRFLAAQVDRRRSGELPLRQITLGGEAVPSALLEELGRLFPEARVSQIYGATEFGTGISVRDRRHGLPASALERDEAADVQIRVVDGELWVRSKHGMLGYYGDDGESDESDGWRPTGDLVEHRGDRLYFVGRRRETINVGGVKVHPVPIEDRALGVPGVRLARVYGRPNPVTGQVVALDVLPEPGADVADLEARLRKACEPLPRHHRPVVVRFVENMETRSQKIFRGPT